MLKNELYTIDGKQADDTAVCYALTLNPQHVIYQAHFPGEPITPGVCIIQMGKELLEEHLQRKLEIVKVKNVKFLAVLSPTETPQVTYQLSRIKENDAEVSVSVVVKTDDVVRAKLSFTCHPYE